MWLGAWWLGLLIIILPPISDTELKPAGGLVAWPPYHHSSSYFRHRAEAEWRHVAGGLVAGPPYHHSSSYFRYRAETGWGPGLLIIILPPISDTELKPNGAMWLGAWWLGLLIIILPPISDTELKPAGGLVAWPPYHHSSSYFRYSTKAE